MSFLSPLFLAGLAALSLPILFHMIRRSPQGRQVFSSLMFLPTSPPRLTKRSSIENWFLLLLRAIALALIAMAFARPLLRQNVLAGNETAAGQRIAILVDTSASMRRGDLWKSVSSELDEVLAGLADRDEVALYRFDDRLISVEPFADGQPLQVRRQSSQRIQQALSEIEPGWGATRLDEALIQLAEDLLQRSSAEEKAAPARIVVISDCQQGSYLDSLQSYTWPEQIPVEFHAVVDDSSGNAHLQTLQPAPEDDDDTWRIRLTNESGTGQDRFDLAWTSTRDAAGIESLENVYVPEGESRTLRIPRPSNLSAGALLLTGDQTEFDNRWFVVPPAAMTCRIGYLGGDDAQSAQSPGYYLRNALVDTTWMKFEFVELKTPVPADWVERFDCLFVTGSAGDTHAASIRDQAARGCIVCWVVEPDAAAALGQVIDEPQLRIEEATLKNYALLSWLDFQHPLFAPFADPRFNDFTAIRFRRVRELRDMAGDDLIELAKFDSGGPAIMMKEIESGAVVVMTSGWHPADSRLGLSTKFVPLIHSLIRLGRTPQRQFETTYVNDVIDVADSTGELLTPEGKSAAVEEGRFAATDRPGIYRSSDSDAQSYAVNVDPRESRIERLPVEDFEQLGIATTSSDARESDEERARQMRIQELEAEQKLWRWLLIAAVVVLFLETFLAGRLTRPELAGATENGS